MKIRPFNQHSRNGIRGPVPKIATRIMVVEDSGHFRGPVVVALLQQPYFKDIHIATSGEEALETFAEVCPDLVLLDFRLPGIDGLETAKRMKEQRPDVKVVLITAYTEQVLERVAKEASVDQVIPKANFSLARLEEVLDWDS